MKAMPDPACPTEISCWKRHEESGDTAVGRVFVYYAGGLVVSTDETGVVITHVQNSSTWE